METVNVNPVIIPVTLDTVFDMSIEQLRDELTKLGQDVRGWLKPAMQKRLTKLLSDKGSGESLSELQLKLKQLELEDKRLEAER